MANFVFRQAKFGILADQDHSGTLGLDFHADTFALAFVTTALTEAVHADVDTLLALFTDASGHLTASLTYTGTGVEYAGTNYARGSGDQTNIASEAVYEGTLSGTSSFAYLTAANTTISSMGATTDTRIVGLVVYKKTSDTDDAVNYPVSYHDFAVQPDGQDCLVQWDAVNGAGTLATAGGVVLKIV